MPQGDGFFLAFADPSSALKACLQAQLVLAAHPWPADGQLIAARHRNRPPDDPLRMGLHTGEAVPTPDDDYVALSVHQAQHAAYYLELAQHQLEALATDIGYDAIDALALDTPNILAAGLQLVDTGRADEVLALFTIIPPPTLVLLPTAVAEVFIRLIEACQSKVDPSQLHNLGAACSYAATLAFFNAAGGHERWCDLARSLPENQYTLLCETIPLAMQGDMQGGAALLGTVFDRYGERLKPLWKADYLAMLALFESTFDHPDGQKHIENAFTINRDNCGPLSQLYLLTVRTAVLSRFDTAAAVETADELARLDRTPRRVLSHLAGNIARSPAGLAEHERTQQLERMRNAVAELAEAGSQVLYAVAGIAEAIAASTPDPALQLACVAETAAKAPGIILNNPGYPQLRHAVTNADAPTLEAWRADTERMSYDEALDTIFQIIQRLIEVSE